MALSIETTNRLLATARGYSQYVIGLGTAVGVLSAANGQDVGQAFTQIYDGVSQIITGGHTLWVIALPICSYLLARMSSTSAKTSNQAAQVQAAVKDPNTILDRDAKASLLDAAANLDEVDKAHPIIVTSHALAAAVPATNVRTS